MLCMATKHQASRLIFCTSPPFKLGLAQESCFDGFGYFCGFFFVSLFVMRLNFLYWMCMGIHEAIALVHSMCTPFLLLHGKQSWCSTRAVHFLASFAWTWKIQNLWYVPSKYCGCHVL